MMINGIPAKVKQPINTEERVELDGKILKTPEKYIYLAYHKPRGIETTLNRKIPNNLADSINYPSEIFPLGRLDKESEGLLLLTNNGSIYNKIAHSKQYQEKEYVVKINKPLSPIAIEKMTNGMQILGKVTRPAKIFTIDAFSFRIILTQGLNRQIRRMCYKLGYEVLSLTRTRIVNIHLGQLLSGEWRHLSEKELIDLFPPSPKI